MWRYMFRGIHHIVDTAAGPVHADADFDAWLDVLPVSSGTTSFAYAGIAGLGLRDLSFDQSDNVKFVDLPELKMVRLLGERVFTGNLRITNPLPSVLNLESKWVSGADDVWSMVHGSVAGKIVTLNGRSQLIDPNYARDDGDDVASAGTKMVPSDLTSDNDLSVVLT